MADYPALPLWTDAWIADTHRMSRKQRGTYIDFLILMWRAPKCRVPNDNRWLEVNMGMTPSEVDKELRPLIKERCNCTGNWITQKRLHQEYLYVTAKSKTRSVIAKARWAKEKDACKSSIPTPTPTPAPSTGSTSGEETSRAQGQGGNGAGAGKNGTGYAKDTVTLKDPKLRIERFMNTLAKRIDLDHPGAPAEYGWSTILAATDANALAHHHAIAICMQAARAMGKGWPRNWPTDGKFFTQTNGADHESH